MPHEVIAPSLNLRSAPRVVPTNRIATLPQGHRVEKLADAEPDWWRVRTTLGGATLEGFAASRFLADEAAAPPAAGTGVTAVHLAANRPDVTRTVTTGRAFPLGEADRPQRDGQSPDVRVRQLHQIIDYLDVETHARYQKTPGATYCNIYAYDFCCLAGAYLPRVWWTSRALVDLAEGKSVAVKYDDTVRELNANALHDWFADFGGQFGWRRRADLDQLQDVANAGGLGVIVAQRTDLGRSGHIVIVVPEIETASAKRVDDRVHLPLQSQAGATNSRCACGTSRWWAGQQFRSFGLWAHE
jgi:hypothetical protein